MASLIPFTDTVLLRRRAGYTAYGEDSYAAPVALRARVVKFDIQAQPSPIRSEASATHGRVEEDLSKTVEILFPAGTALALDDRVDALGVALAVIGLFSRADLFGRVSHLQATLRRIEV